MSNNLSHYQKEREQEITILKEKVKSLEDEIVQVKLKFELRKNDLQDEASRELNDYQPKSMGLSFDVDPSNFEVSDDAITGTLKKMFKID